jgi:PAS domain S-box-containing protein
MMISSIPQPQGALALFIDISEQKRAEQALAAALEEQRAQRLAALNLMEDACAAQRTAEAAADQLRKLSMAVEQSPEKILITDLDARIEYVNEAFLRETGYTRAEILGAKPDVLRSGKTPPERYAELWATLRRGETWKGEFRNRRKDGSEFTDFAIITPIRQPDGHISHYVSVGEDITEKKRLGEELDAHRHHLTQLVVERTAELEQARSEAEKANQAKSTFLASMSHEIRTPMNAILGFSHLMRRDATSSAQIERLDKIDAAAKHLLEVINDILDLSKIEADKIELVLRDFAVDDVLGHVATLIGEAAAAKGLTIRTDVDAVPHWLRGDLTRLRQALLNYAGNALKFTQRGSVVLRARLVETAEARCLVRFEVEDSGIGIAPEVIPQLFQPFQQADTSIAREFGGTGLGLTITRRLAQMMEGDAGADSTPGQGSCFWFTAWLGYGTPNQAGAEAHDSGVDFGRHAGARILLVEDNEINREVASELLSGSDFVVDTAENGRIAVDKMSSAEQHYDLILMDVLMPVMDGLKATRAIRQLPNGHAVPIIAMTANAFEDDRQACIAAGMDDFAAKPIDPDALFATLNTWLSVRMDNKAGGGINGR